VGPAGTIVVLAVRTATRARRIVVASADLLERVQTYGAPHGSSCSTCKAVVCGSGAELILCFFRFVAGNGRLWGQPFFPPLRDFDENCVAAAFGADGNQERTAGLSAPSLKNH